MVKTTPLDTGIWVQFISCTVVAGDLGAVDAGDAQVLAVVLQLTHDCSEGSHDQGHGTLGLYCTSAFLVVVVVQLLVVVVVQLLLVVLVQLLVVVVVQLLVVMVVFVVIVGVLALITWLAAGGSHYLGNALSPASWHSSQCMPVLRTVQERGQNVDL